jgi:lectin-like protein
MGMYARLFAVTLLVSMAGCGDASIGEPPGGNPDAGEAPPPDGAPPPTPDAAPGSPDAAEPPDAAPPPDAFVCVGGDASTQDPATGHCYFFVNVLATWDDAESDCNFLGGHLAAPTDLEEDLLITLMMEDFFGTLESAPDTWLGGTDQASEDNWEWSSGETFSFTRWRSGEPNDGGTNNGPEDCMVLEARNNGLWDDRGCSRTFRYICEVAPN